MASMLLTRLSPTNLLHSPFLHGLLCSVITACTSPPSPSPPPSQTETTELPAQHPQQTSWGTNESKARLRLSREVLEAGDAQQRLRDAKKLYKVPLVAEELEGQDSGRPFLLALKDDAMGVHFLSVLKSAGWAGHNSALVVPSNVQLHMQGSPQSKAAHSPESWEQWEEAPLHVDIMENGIEIWRVTDELLEEDASEPAGSYRGSSSSELSDLLKKLCENTKKCTPFLLTIHPRSKAKSLKLLLAAFDELGDSAKLERHALLLFNGQKEVHAIARNIQSRGHLERGNIKAGRVQETIRAKSDAFKSCRMKGSTKGAPPSGTLKLKFTIEKSGEVSNAIVLPSSDVKDRAVQECVVQTLSKLTFPAPRGGRVTITYPISLSQ